MFITLNWAEMSLGGPGELQTTRREWVSAVGVQFGKLGKHFGWRAGVWAGPGPLLSQVCAEDGQFRRETSRRKDPG